MPRIPISVAFPGSWESGLLGSSRDVDAKLDPKLESLMINERTMKCSMKTTAQEEVPLFPPPADLDALRKRLPVFKPHNLGELIEEARGDTTETDLDMAVLQAMRRRNAAQVEELARSLGIDPTSPDGRRAVYLLGVRYFGVGQISVRPRRRNRNPATWTVEQDASLVREVVSLTSKGSSERKAVRSLAGDRAKRALFPYREKRSVSKANELDRRANALRRRLHTLKSRPNGLAEALGANLAGLSELEWILRASELRKLPVPPLVKNQGG